MRSRSLMENKSFLVLKIGRGVGDLLRRVRGGEGRVGWRQEIFLAVNLITEGRGEKRDC